MGRVYPVVAVSGVEDGSRSRGDRERDVVAEGDDVALLHASSGWSFRRAGAVETVANVEPALQLVECE